MLKLPLIGTWCLVLTCSTLAEYTAVQVTRICPKTTDGSPNIAVRSETPTHALAKCKNGIVPLSSTDDVIYSITGQFDPSYKGSDCLFHKQKAGVYSVDLEVWWGSGDDQILLENRTHSVSCEYDEHGTLLQPNDKEEWSLSPLLLTPSTSGVVQLTLDLVDMRGEKLKSNHLTVGRRVQLVAEDVSGVEMVIYSTKLVASKLKEAKCSVLSFGHSYFKEAER